MTRYSSTMTEALQEVREGFSPKQIKMAIGIANDPRYKGGNYDGAVDAIEKIKRGLSNHKQVAAVLKRLNTDFDPEIQEEIEIDEMKMDDPKLNKIFDKLKKGQTIKLKTSSTISKGKDFVDYIVKSKNTVNKGRVEKVTLVTKGNEKSVKKFLYKRDGKVTFAIGDMGASIDDIKEAKSSTGYELYHKDFSSAMKHAYDFAKKKFGIEVDPKEIDDKVATGPKKPSNGKTNSYSLKAKGGKKGIQVQVYNTGKNYELNMYKEEVISEEEEPQKSDGAKAVDQGREDKKKTRIAQLQLQIAKAQETINQLNAQEK